METTTENLSNALLDVRRAHRILYAYQKRMSDLAYFIKRKLDMPKFRGFKHFSRPISKSSGYLTIRHDMWAWDYLYSYLFEYYLGKKRLAISCTTTNLVLFSTATRDTSTKMDREGVELANSVQRMSLALSSYSSLNTNPRTVNGYGKTDLIWKG